MRLGRVVVVAALAALAPLACTSSTSLQASAPRLASPSPSPTIGSDSKAADLRTRIDLLLGEHVFVVAKESGAIAGNRTAEIPSYATLLTTNGSDLADVMRSAFGDTAASQFDQIMTIQNNYFVEYAIGLVTHNQNKANGAMSGLVNGFVPQFSQFAANTAGVPLDPATQLATEQVGETKALIDDEVALDYNKTYADLHTAYTRSASVGDALARSIAMKFADKFPGDPSSKAADLRASLNELLQEHLYLVTMGTAAATGGRGTEQASALRALAANADTLGTVLSGLFGAPAGTQFDQVWAAKDAALIAYAGAADEAAKQAALGSLTDAYVQEFSGLVQASTGIAGSAFSSAVSAQVTTAVKVIDDQRAKALDQVAGDDRTADSAIQVVADLLTSATVAKLPAKFKP